MSLEDQIKQTLDDFENTTSEKILEVLSKIKPEFKSKLISEYLQGKIHKILEEVISKPYNTSEMMQY